MIASVVATLEPDGRPHQDVINEIAQIPNVEIGDATAHPRRVPITIDSPGPGALEQLTRRLEQCSDVMFVDVVFVHFENETGTHPENSVGTANE
jgi:nitrate reductase NapAB chaperone NapD